MTTQEIKDLFASGGENKQKQAIDEAIALAQQDIDIQNILISIKAQFNQYSNANNSGMLNSSDATTQFNKITAQFLGALGGLKDTATPPPAKELSKQPNANQYNTKNMYNLLNACYNDEALTMFCTFNFEKVAENFSAGMNKNQKILALLDYTKRQLQNEQLLRLVQEEFPQQYEQYKPYY